MRRRAFLSTLAALACARAGAQEKKRWRVGVLRPAPDDAVFRKNFATFLPALRELARATEIEIQYRGKSADATEMKALADELVRSNVDAILAIATPGVTAASIATKTLPIIAVDLESDPVGQKLATTLARPGGNVTGVFLDFPELSGKWMQLLKEVMPKLDRAAVLFDPAISSSLVDGAVAAGSTTRVQISKIPARAPAQLEQAFEEAVKQKAQAVLALSSPAYNSARKQIADLAQKHRLPAVMPFPEFADEGGLMAYGPHLTSLFRQAAAIMAKVVQGGRPGDLPIERPTKFELVLNLRTARMFGLKVPQSVIVRADRVVE